MTVDADERRYEFGSAAEDDSLVLGLRASQVGLVAWGLITAVLVVRARPSSAGFGIAIILLGVVAAATFWPVNGRTIEQWVPTLVRHGLQRVTGRDTYLSEAPLLGHGSDGAAPQRPPDTLDGVRLLAVPVEDGGGREVGVAYDRRLGTYSAVLSVRGRAFQLADAVEQERRLAMWGGVLTGLARAGSPIHRIQWVERTVPEDGDSISRHLEETRALDGDHPAMNSYRELVDGAGRAAPRHETYLVVSVSERRAREAVRRAGGGGDEAVRVLLREVRSLHRQLVSGDVFVDGILTPRLLSAAIRSAFDPTVQRVRSASPDVPPDGEGRDLSAAWPLACETSWSTYRTGAVWHATYWVAQWPRVPVGPDFLVPLLLGTTGLRTVAVTMAPVSPLRAHREVEQALLKQAADEELRARAGFMGTARRQRVREAVARREQELADGHADYRVSGYVTVSATSREELDVRCGEVEQTAHQASLDLVRLHGRQDLAFTYSLPLGRGLAGRP